jgi:hypothetical protein
MIIVQNAGRERFFAGRVRRPSGIHPKLPSPAMLRSVTVLAVVLFASGCASTTGTFFNRPVVEDSVKNAISTVSLAADRRTVVVVTEGPNRTRFCAEPPPDTASGLKTELESSLKGNKAGAEIDAKLNDQFGTTVTVIAERTAKLDAFRTGVYALCQYHLNGAISREDVKPLFERLIDAFAASEPATLTQTASH